MPSYTLPGGTIKFESEKTNGRYQALVSSGGSVTTALSGENADMSYSMTGAATGDTLTLTAKGATDFGGAGPQFVMLLDAAQTDGNGDVIPRYGTNVTDTNNSPPTILESDSNLPGGVGWKMGANDSSFGSGTRPFFVKVSCPSHTKSFESRVTYLPSARRDSIVTALNDDYATNGERSQNKWGFKFIWNAPADGEFGDNSLGAAFYIAELYDWYQNFGDGYWQPGVEIYSNTPSFPTHEFPNIDLVAPGNNQSTNANYWRDAPHQAEYYYDLGSSDTSVADSTAWASVYTPNGVIGTQELTNIDMKDSNEATLEPMAFYTYPGFVRGFNIPLGYNAVEGLAYKAIGDGAYARVAITNHSDYFQATKRTILEVSSQSDWASGQVVARLHGGWFDLANMGGMYINAIDASNTQVASVQIGSA